MLIKLLWLLSIFFTLFEQLIIFHVLNSTQHNYQSFSRETNRFGLAFSSLREYNFSFAKIKFMNIIYVNLYRQKRNVRWMDGQNEEWAWCVCMKWQFCNNNLFFTHFTFIAFHLCEHLTKEMSVQCSRLQRATEKIEWTTHQIEHENCTL